MTTREQYIQNLRTSIKKFLKLYGHRNLVNYQFSYRDKLIYSMLIDYARECSTLNDEKLYRKFYKSSPDLLKIRAIKESIIDLKKKIGMI